MKRSEIDIRASTIVLQREKQDVKGYFAKFARKNGESATIYLWQMSRIGIQTSTQLGILQPKSENNAQELYTMKKPSIQREQKMQVGVQNADLQRKNFSDKLRRVMISGSVRCPG